MKAIALVMILLGCASSGNSFPLSYPTLSTTNISGLPVQLFINTGGSTQRIGRAWPGKDCFLIRQIEQATVYFGLIHLGKSIVWGPIPVRLDPNWGWALDIGQPERAIFDLQRMTPAEKC